jgi:hypothetical protein
MGGQGLCVNIAPCPGSEARAKQFSPEPALPLVLKNSPVPFTKQEKLKSSLAAVSTRGAGLSFKILPFSITGKYKQEHLKRPPARQEGKFLRTAVDQTENIIYYI